jgi:hypothetical protein
MRLSMAALAAGALLLFSAIAHAAEEKHSMDDLKALAGQEAWTELVQHLGDIPPAKRDEAWQKLAEQGAVGYLDGEKNQWSAFMAADGLTKQFPTLKKSPVFMAKRGEVGLKGVETCYREDPGAYAECHKNALELIAADPSTDLAFKAGKVVRLNQNAAAAVPFFAKAMKGRKGAAECKDDDLKLAVIAGLGQPTEYSDVPLAKEIASEDCFDALKDALKTEMGSSGKGSYFFTNACGFLKEHDALSGLQAKQCSSK